MGQSWSSMRKQLEQQNICEALKGRIQYFATRYRESHDQEGRVAIRLDGQEIFKSCYFDWCNTRSNVVEDSLNIRQDSSSYWEYWDKVHLETENRGSFDQFAFYDAFYFYQNHNIEDSLNSENAIVKLFVDIDKQPIWLQPFYHLRVDAEGINES